MVTKAGNKIELDSWDPELIRGITDCDSRKEHTDWQAGRLTATCGIRNVIFFLFFSLPWWVFSDPHYQETDRPTCKQVQIWISALSTLKQRLFQQRPIFLLLWQTPVITSLTRRTTMQYLETLHPIILGGKMQHLYQCLFRFVLSASWAEACRISHTH